MIVLIVIQPHRIAKPKTWVWQRSNSKPGLRSEDHMILTSSWLKMNVSFAVVLLRHIIVEGVRRRNLLEINVKNGAHRHNAEVLHC